MARNTEFPRHFLLILSNITAALSQVGSNLVKYYFLGGYDIVPVLI